MARILIQPSALRELLAVEPRQARRRLVTEITQLGPDRIGDRLAAGGRCRMRSGGWTVLYRRRGADLVISGLRPSML